MYLSMRNAPPRKVLNVFYVLNEHKKVIIEHIGMRGGVGVRFREGK